MKKLILIMINLLSFVGIAQVPDTIFANENHNTAIFFPEKIRQGIVGSENFVFSYNEEHPQYFGLLNASPGSSSNLLVLTDDGEIYSFIVSHRTELPQLTYFLQPEQSLGNEVPEKKGIVEPEEERSPETLVIDSALEKQKHLEQLASYYLLTSAGTLKQKNKKGIELKVNELIHYEDKVFMVFNLRNTSGIAFEPEYLRVFFSKGNRKRNASFQKLMKEPVYTHKFPDVVRDQQNKRFVYVFPKFTIGEGERMEVELREKKGNRFLKMGLRR